MKHAAVDVVEGVRRGLVEAGAEGRPGPVHARGVEEDDLAVGPVEHAADPGARRVAASTT